MGVCCDNSFGSKKFKIKVKRKRKHKSKDKVQDMNFEIIDVSQNKTHQILSKTKPIKHYVNF